MYFLICCEIPYWYSLSQTEILLGITHWFLLGSILQIVESANYLQKCGMNNKKVCKKNLLSVFPWRYLTSKITSIPCRTLCSWICCINSHLRIKCVRSLRIMKVSHSMLQGSFTEIKGLHRWFWGLLKKDRIALTELEQKGFKVQKKVQKWYFLKGFRLFAISSLGEKSA